MNLKLLVVYGLTFHGKERNGHQIIVVIIINNNNKYNNSNSTDN